MGDESVSKDPKAKWIVWAGWDGELLTITAHPLQELVATAPVALVPSFDVPIGELDNLPQTGEGEKEKRLVIALNIEPLSGRLWVLLQLEKGHYLEVWDLFKIKSLGVWTVNWGKAVHS